MLTSLVAEKSIEDKINDVGELNMYIQHVKIWLRDSHVLQVKRK